MIKKKRLTRDIWTVITKKRYNQKVLSEAYFKGIVGLLYIDQVSSPQRWMNHQKEYTVCDSGMKWLQLIPEGESFVITAMYNQNNEIVLWYIDMIVDYGMDPDGIAYFNDLYLDIVIFANGHIGVDDLHELTAAFHSNEISSELYQLAIDTSERLQQGLLSNLSQLTELCHQCLHAVEI